MPGFVPALDCAALAALRQLVQAFQAKQHAVSPMAQLVELAGQVDATTPITIDLEASRILGGTLIILSPPPAQERPAVAEQFTRREAEVAGLIAEGCSNKQIAKRLHITPATVKDHVHRILAKTGLPNRTAIAVAMHDGHG